ncbi:MAG: type IV pilus assembly protein PilM, partial [Actinobacteria bacterium]|nr:type IV pilus assembly protein PilM [Actinomycetota bacterium]
MGLKIGASSLAAARVETNGSVELVQVARDALPPGVVAGGEIRDVPALAGALKEFFGRHKLPTRAVRVGIANNRIGVRTIDLTGIADPKQIANAVRFRAQEALPIPLDQAVLDYQVLAEGADAEGQPTKRVLLVVAYRDLIDTYVASCRAAGLRLVGIDLDAFALLRALTPAEAPVLANGERSALVAVSVGADRTTLAVSDGFTCEFTRVLEWGGTSLTGALARALAVEPEEAERIKKEIALDGTVAPEGLTDDGAAKAREALRTGLTTFARELVSSLQFYQGQPDSLGIREVVLAGGTAELRGLAAALQSLIGVNVRVGDPLTGVTPGKKIKELPTPAYAIPIG